MVGHVPRLSRRSYLPRRFYLLALAAILPAGLFPRMLCADLILSQTGANGKSGETNNMVTPPTGEQGQIGGDATEDASGDATAPNYNVEGDATGGTGGNGGNGGTSGGLFGSGGNGGNGGNATASAYITNHPLAATSATAKATGGNGGNGGNGASAKTGHGTGGVGGDGGSVSIGTDIPLVSYNAGDHDGDNEVSSLAEGLATGGNGGNGGTGAGGAGGNGGGVTMGFVHAVAGDTNLTTDTGSALAEAEATGGNGGVGMSGASGGNGASVSLANVVSGVSTKFVTLMQSATGGNGGGTASGGNPGLAGNAASALTIPSDGSTSISTTGSLLAHTTATGGNGGNAQNTVGASGGSAFAFTTATVNCYQLDGSAQATGGYGSNLTGGTGSAGAGGIAWATASIFSTSTIAASSGGAAATSMGGGGGSAIGAAGSAGAGGDAFSNAIWSAQMPALPYLTPSIEASSTGGLGGSFSGSGMGVAGAAGNAIASATGTSETGGGSLWASIYSAGGSGGSILGSANGNGANGGNATFNVICNEANDSAVKASVSVAGGFGGVGQGAGFSGGNGGIPTLGQISAITTSGNAEIDLAMTGGSGGAGKLGATGGNGISVSLNNAISSPTSGNLYLNQSASGGASGGSDGANPGTPGDATSILNFTNNAATGLLSASAYAGGGDAGDVENINGGPGGSSLAWVTVAGSSNVVAGATSQGSSGASIAAGQAGLRGGTSGTSNASVVGVSTGTALNLSGVSVAANANGYVGGTISPSLTGTGGDGGPTTAFASASGMGPDLVLALSTAQGASGGAGSGIGYLSGNGGNALASAIANCSGSGAASASASASAGNGNTINNSATPGLTGSASATASATSTTCAGANATGNGASGIALATSRLTQSGLFSFVQSTALSQVDASASSLALAFANQAAPAFLLFPPPLAPAATAASVVSPLSSDVAQRWTTDSNVQNIFTDDPAKVSALLQTTLQHPSNGLTHTYSSVLEVNENQAQLGTGDLVLGLLGSVFSAAGINPGDSLRFRIERNGSPLVDQTFTTNTDALNYFQDTVLNLGSPGADLNGANLDLQILVDFTTSHTGAGYGVQMALGNVPGAPGAVWNNPLGGAWATPVNWAGRQVPIGPATNIFFTGAITAPQTVTLNQITTAGSILLSNPSGYTINPGAPGFSLAMDNGSQPALINVSLGNHAIAAPITFTPAGLSLAVANSITLSLSAAISGAGSLALTETGRVSLLADSGTAKIAGLSVAPGGTLDLANNRLIIETAGPSDKSTQLAFLQTALQSARTGAGGPWTGTGVTSSTVAADAAAGTNHSYHTVVAIVDNGAYPVGTGYTSFGGQPVDSNSIIITRALAGDANLDGTVNNTDLVALLTHFTLAGQTQATGDYNGDGTVNNTDLVALLTDYDQSLPAGMSLAPGDGPAGAVALPGAVAAVPEPGAIAVWLLAAPLLLRRRRGRNVPKGGENGELAGADAQRFPNA